MKISEPKKLKDGTYRIQLRLSGVSTCVYGETEAECRNKALLIKAGHATGKNPIVKASTLTLSAIIDGYITAHKPVLSPSTLLGYKNIQKNRFKNFKDLKVSDIDWQLMVNEELQLKSQKTVKNGWGLVHTALSFYGVSVPDVKLAAVPVKEIPFLQPDEISKFCESVKGRSYEIPALLELHGLRLSEVRGLSWNNIDLKKEVIRINGAMVRGTDGDVQKQTNKTKTSTRIVPIMIPQLLTALNAVENKTGSVMTIGPQTLLRDVNRACERAGVTVTGNHGLRHSFASLCYHLRISERQVMEWGGWSDYTTMHRIYIRLAAADESDARKTVKEFFATA